MEKVALNRFSAWSIESIPDYALPYLCNGDASGLSPDDLRNIDKWADEMRVFGFTPDLFSFVRLDGDALYVDPGQEASFTSCPAFGLPCDCFTCLFVK